MKTKIALFLIMIILLAGCTGSSKRKSPSTTTTTTTETSTGTTTETSTGTTTRPISTSGPSADLDLESLTSTEVYPMDQVVLLATVRNTARFLLSNLDGFSPQEAFDELLN